MMSPYHTHLMYGANIILALRRLLAQFPLLQVVTDLYTTLNEGAMP